MIFEDGTLICEQKVAELLKTLCLLLLKLGEINVARGLRDFPHSCLFLGHRYISDPFSRNGKKLHNVYTLSEIR